MSPTPRASASARDASASAPEASAPKNAGVSSDTLRPGAADFQTAAPELIGQLEREVSGWLAFRSPLRTLNIGTQNERH